MGTVLITGSAGQIGSELTPALRSRYGSDRVVASGLAEPGHLDEPYVQLDVTDAERITEVVETYDVDQIFNLAAILSAKGERDPQLTYRVNIEGVYNILECARTNQIDQVMIPSTIAVFGRDTPDNPGEKTILRPTTMYGISKVFLELIANYYYETFNLDVRGVRFPGILSYQTPPGGGTTDYAVEAFYGAIESGAYTYFVREDTRLPMMYMPDAIRALIDLSEADDHTLNYRCEYNVAALDFTPAELTEAIQVHRPDFQATYEPDDRQAIADSWPNTIDDSAARADWGWAPEYDLEAMVEDMLTNLEARRAD